MLKRAIVIFTALIVSGVIGCGSGDPELNTAPLTEEQKKAIEEADRKVQEEEEGPPGKPPRRRGGARR